MLKVALTGNVASGKSTVADVWSAAGIPVIRADDLARDVVAPGSRGLSQVIEAFGGGLLRADGTLDRSALRGRVFRDPSDRARLEGMLHPLIAALRQVWVSHHEAEGTPLVVAEIPLLFEVGLQSEYDIVVLVTAAPQEQLRRLTVDRGLDREEASRVMASQMPAKEKLTLADYVLDNGGSMEDLKVRSLALLDLLRARARKGGSR